MAAAGKTITKSQTSTTSSTGAIDLNEHLSLNPNPPGKPVRLVFSHHAVGEDWLDDSKGGLDQALADDNFYVSDTNYGWGPPDADVGSENIGDHTDIGNWYNWFVGPNSPTYLSALYAAAGQTVHRGDSAAADGIGDQPGGGGQRARLQPLAGAGLAGYPYRNVAVFDFYNVLTSNGGSPGVSDAGSGSGNHHRYSPDLDAIEYLTSQGSNFSAYATDDSHPSAAGERKATDEFVEMLNVEYHAWQGE